MPVTPATYYVQFAAPAELDSLEAPSDRRWHTIARVQDRDLAREMKRLVESSYLRTEMTMESRFMGRAVSRSALRRDGALHHAEWELGIGTYRAYGEGLRARAERNLALVADPAAG